MQSFNVPHFRQQPRRPLPFPKQVYRPGQFPTQVIIVQKPVPNVNPTITFNRMYLFAFRQGPGQPKEGTGVIILTHGGRYISRVSSAVITFWDSGVRSRSTPLRAASLPSNLKPAVLSSGLVTSEVSKKIKQKRKANRGAICCWVGRYALFTLMMLKYEIVGLSKCAWLPLYSNEMVKVECWNVRCEKRGVPNVIE